MPQPSLQTNGHLGKLTILHNTWLQLIDNVRTFLWTYLSTSSDRQLVIVKQILQVHVHTCSVKHYTFLQFLTYSAQ